MAASKESELDEQKTDTDTSRRQILTNRRQTLRQTELRVQEKRTETESRDYPENVQIVCLCHNK